MPLEIIAGAIAGAVVATAANKVGSVRKGLAYCIAGVLCCYDKIAEAGRSIVSEAREVAMQKPEEVPTPSDIRPQSFQTPLKEPVVLEPIDPITSDV